MSGFLVNGAGMRSDTSQKLVPLWEIPAPLHSKKLRL
jgi:hypothetical protein